MSKSDAVSFSIFKRKKKKNSPQKVSPNYYAQFKLADGSWTNAVSTRQTTQEAAKQWCLDQIKVGQIVLKQGVRFKEFATGFFAWDNQWAMTKRARRLRLSERWCSELDRLTDKMLIPSIGEMKLTDIDENTLDRLTIDLYKKGFAGSYVNKALIAMKAILTAACKQKLIKYVPPINKVENDSKTKGILSIDEVRRLFSSVKWKSYRGYVGSLLAATTGLRLGELQALTLPDLHLDDSYIHIWRSWDNKFKRFNQTTKTGKTRNIFIPENVKRELQLLIDINPYAGQDSDIFLFFSHRRNDRPAREKTFADSLYHAMKRIGITEKERCDRNISFHSWRHFLNSLLINSKIPLVKVQQITGHSTNRMTDHYFHLDGAQDVIDAVQGALFPALPDQEVPGDPLEGVQH